MNLLDRMRQLVMALDDAGIPYALCGGLAMAVHSFPRATMDVDLLIEESSLEAAKAIAGELGYTLDVGLMQLAGGKVKLYRLTMLETGTDEVLPLDLLLVTPKLRDVWEGRDTVLWEGRPLHVVSRAGLIEMKRLRGSGQDQDDIKRLEGEV